LVGQSVPHAHLHAAPARGAEALLSVVGAGRRVLRTRGIGGLQRWYRTHGPYLYCELDDRGHILTPTDAPSGYLKAAFAEVAGLGPALGADGAAATSEVREHWRRHEESNGQAHTRVVTCLLENDGAVCLLKRSELVGSARGKWHVVSGYLPDGKDPLEHAYDEVAEETGLTRGHVQLQQQAGPLVFADRNGGRPWQVYTYLFATATRAVTLNWEHVEFAWVSPQALTQFDCVPWLGDLYRAVSDGVAGAQN
jgi:8-oxo-dGTP pyrophosphatase MutT (NUDIX family)